MKLLLHIWHYTNALEIQPLNVGYNPQLFLKYFLKAKFKLKFDNHLKNLWLN
jgi:hypothetical protein